MRSVHRRLWGAIGLGWALWLGGVTGGCAATSEAATAFPSNGTEDGPWEMPERALCEGSYAVVPSQTGRINGDALAEISGLVASPSQPGVIWAHNDSGDQARLYALDAGANVLAIVALSGVDAVDFEDMAAASCPDGSGPCLWIGDVGDNEARRDNAIVYALPEPQLDASVPREPARLVANEGWRFPVRYPNGPVDVEALVVRPDGSGFYLFEKSPRNEARVYRSPSPLVDDTPLLLEEIVRFASPGIDVEHGRKITGADLHPTGKALILRVYTGIYEYGLTDVDALASLDKIDPGLVALGPLAEPQGEAVAYDDTGRGIWTMSEDPQGQGNQPLHHLSCP